MTTYSWTLTSQIRNAKPGWKDVQEEYNDLWCQKQQISQEEWDSDLQMTHGFDDMIMNGEKSSFGRMMFDMADWKEFWSLLVDK